MSTTTQGQAILAILETAGGGPLITLLTNLKAHEGNALLQGADWIAFVAQAPTAGIQLELVVENQILTAVLTKVQGYLTTKAAAPAAAPVPASVGTAAVSG